MYGKEKLGPDKSWCGPRKPAGERLRDVAAGLFYQRGIRAVGVDEIVHETGVTKPTLYRAFASKDDLVAACLQVQLDEAKDRLRDIAADLPGDPLGQIRAIVQALADDMATPDYRGCAVTNAAVEFPDPGHPVRIVVEGCKDMFRSRLTDLAREMGVPDPEQLGDGLSLLLEGASMSRHTSGSQGPSAALMRSAEALIQGALRTA